MVQFKATKREMEAIMQIAKRAVALAARFDGDYKMQDAIMDLDACHSNGCALRLFDLLTADDMNFAHDVFGIRRHLNRQTGQLEDCFLPRFALPAGVEEVHIPS
jgi:hypothetical protein